MRRICCEKCGVFKPTPPEDAARGLFSRRTTGQTKLDLVCDQCGQPLPKGSNAVAETIPKQMYDWEIDYMNRVKP